jgi:hypothetical protein
MGKFYARGRYDAPEGVGIDLTDMTTGVGLFMWNKGDRGGSALRLTPDEADRLADELRRVAQFVRDDNDMSDGGPNDPLRYESKARPPTADDVATARAIVGPHDPED